MKSEYDIVKSEVEENEMNETKIKLEGTKKKTKGTENKLKEKEKKSKDEGLQNLEIDSLKEYEKKIKQDKEGKANIADLREKLLPDSEMTEIEKNKIDKEEMLRNDDEKLLADSKKKSRKKEKVKKTIANEDDNEKVLAGSEKKSGKIADDGLEIDSKVEKDFENIEEIADVDPKSNDLEAKPLNHAEEDSKIVADDENDAKELSEEYVDVLGP